MCVCVCVCVYVCVYVCGFIEPPKMLKVCNKVLQVFSHLYVGLRILYVYSVCVCEWVWL